MNTDKIYTIDDFLLNVINYGRMIGFLVAFPSLNIPEYEMDDILVKRKESLEFLKDTYNDIKFYIDNDIFTIGSVIDSMYTSAVHVLPTLESVDWDTVDGTEEDVKEHIELMKQTSYIIVSMIITNIMTDDVYPEKSIMRFIEID